MVLFTYHTNHTGIALSAQRQHACSEVSLGQSADCNNRKQIFFLPRASGYHRSACVRHIRNQMKTWLDSLSLDKTTSRSSRNKLKPLFYRCAKHTPINVWIWSCVSISFSSWRRHSEARECYCLVTKRVFTCTIVMDIVGNWGHWFQIIVEI